MSDDIIPLFRTKYLQDGIDKYVKIKIPVRFADGNVEEYDFYVRLYWESETPNLYLNKKSDDFFIGLFVYHPISRAYSMARLSVSFNGRVHCISLAACCMASGRRK